VSLDLWEDLLVKVSYARFFVPNQVHNQYKKDGSTGGGGEEARTSFKRCATVEIMDESSYRLNFDLGKKSKIHHHS
jgi:hypothetical protein